MNHVLVTASISSSFHAFFKAISDFASNLAAVHWGWLGIGLLAFTGYLLVRSIASRNVLRAAYPRSNVSYVKIAGAYIAGFGFNSVIPAHSGSVIRLFLTKSSIARSSYPAVGAAFFVESLFDMFMTIPVMTFAFTQGVFPKPPDFSKLPAFDLAFFAGHMQLTLFLLTILGLLILIGFAYLADHVRAFWTRISQGVTILHDRKRYFTHVFLIQFGAWLLRFGAFWCFLEAFRVPANFRNVMLVFGVSAVSSIVPFTPGGAGVQQALLVKVFSGAAATATVAAYSVGQQIAIAAWGFGLGLACVVFIFRFRSFREVIEHGRASRQAESS